MASIAEFYSANLAEEVRKGMRQKVLRGGWPHQPPRGYVTKRGERKGASTIEVHPREALLVRRAFELFATRAYSIGSLAEVLAKDGLCARSGKPLAHSYLRTMLENPFYVGRLEWAELTIDGRHTPLVSAVVFDQVQAALRVRTKDRVGRSGLADFPLRGLAICAACRGRMIVERHGRWNYYRCGRNAYRADVCRAKYCRTERAHEDLQKLLHRLPVTKDLAECILRAATALAEQRLHSQREEREACARSLADLSTREMKLTDAFSKAQLSSESFESAMASIRVQRKHFETLVSSTPLALGEVLGRIKNVMALAVSMLDLSDALDGRRQSELVKVVFRCLVISADGIVGHSLAPAFAALRDSPADPQRIATKLVGECFESDPFVLPPDFRFPQSI